MDEGGGRAEPPCIGDEPCPDMGTPLLVWIPRRRRMPSRLPRWRRSALPGGVREHGPGHAQAGEPADREVRSSALLLRSRTDRVRTLPPASGSGTGLCGGGALVDPEAV